MFKFKKSLGDTSCATSGCVDPGDGSLDSWGRQPRHGHCVDCGRVTCARRMRMNPKTLRRHLVYVCQQDYIWPSEATLDREAELAKKRTETDFLLISEPISRDAIVPDSMKSQYEGKSRNAVRAFFLSSASVATVPGVDASTLNSTIGTLGLHEVMYAETRGTDTVLRRVA